MFIYTSLLVGPLMPKQSERLEFPYVDMHIISLSASCGCSEVEDDKLKQKVRVKVTAPEIPLHLLDKPMLKGDKHITVKYHLGDPNNEQEVKLTFTLTTANPKYHGK